MFVRKHQSCQLNFIMSNHNLLLHIFLFIAVLFTFSFGFRKYSKKLFLSQKLAFSFQFQHKICRNDVYIYHSFIWHAFFSVVALERESSETRASKYMLDTRRKNLCRFAREPRRLYVTKQITWLGVGMYSICILPNFWTTSIFTAASNRLQCDTNK